MIVEIFDKPKQPDGEPLRLRLQQDGCSVAVVAVDASGKAIPCGFLIGFNSDGTITRHRGVSGRLGFQLGDGNRVKEASE